MKILRTDPDRFGIRARLLTLLLPAVIGLLVLDSLNDYRALRGSVQDAYDEAMLESVSALRSHLALAPDGRFQLQAPLVVPLVPLVQSSSPAAPVQAVAPASGASSASSAAVPAVPVATAAPVGTAVPAAPAAVAGLSGGLMKQLHVGLTPTGGTAAQGGQPPREITLLGAGDLPAPPEPSEPAVTGVTGAATATRPPGAPTSADGAALPSTVWYDSNYQGRSVRVVALRDRIVDGRGQAFDLLIQAAESTLPRDRAQAASLQQELFRDARMVAVMTLLVWLGVTWSLRPLERLRKTVLDSKGQDLRPLDTSDVPHEVEPLVDAVNQHLASYRELLEEQQQFLADASHQLRTPLAIMLTQAGVALREKDPDLLHETLRAIVVQIARSRRLCEQLLSLAHASDRQAPAEAPETVDLNTVARDVVLQYLTLAHDKDIDLGWVDGTGDGPGASLLDRLDLEDEEGEQGEEGDRRDQDAADGHGDASAGTEPPGDKAAPRVPVVAVRARGEELHEVLSNLVHNAIVYTPEGGRITVRVGMQDGRALAEVSDDGPGIAPSQRAAVFERFRQAAGRGKGHGGSGLGLAIARAYARRNGGDIVLADTVAPAGTGTGTGTGTGDGPRPTGLRATLTLPLA